MPTPFCFFYYTAVLFPVKTKVFSALPTKRAFFYLGGNKYRYDCWGNHTYIYGIRLYDCGLGNDLINSDLLSTYRKYS